MTDKAVLKDKREILKVIKEIKAVEDDINELLDIAAQTGEKLQSGDKKVLANLKKQKQAKQAQLGIDQKSLAANKDKLTAEEKSAALKYDIKKNDETLVKLGNKLQGLEESKSLISKETYETLKLQLQTDISRISVNMKIAKSVQDQHEKTEAVKKAMQDQFNSASQMLDTFKEITAAMAKSPLFLMAAAAMAVVKAMEFLNGKTKEFQEKIGGSVTQGKQLRNELAGAQIHAKALGYDAAAAAGALTEEMGSLNSVSGETVKAMGRMEKGLGVSLSTSAKLLASMTSLTGESQASALSTMEFGASLAMANDVAPGAVMEDIAGNTEAFAAYGKDGGKNMIKAAVAARKLGLELGTMVKISDSLLEFESSIQAEMEASMLIGKQLNYNKARELALSGDLEGATKSVMDQIGGAAEFQAMNVMQRKALADSIGVSVEEMSALASGKVEMKQPDKTSEEQLKDSMDDSKLTMMNLITADNALKLAVGILTAAMIANTLSQGFLGKTFKGFGGKMSSLFGKGKSAIGTGATKTMDLARRGKGAVGRGASKTMELAGKAKGAVGRGAKSVMRAGGVVKGAIGSAATTVGAKGMNVLKAAKGGVGRAAAKVAGKGAGKALLKKIPGIGLVAGLGFAASRLMKGDALGALGEVASGAASIIPGIGTAVSAAIDVGMIARDASTAAKKTAETAQDATKVQIEEKKKINAQEKSANALRAEAIEAEKAAKDALVVQAKEAEKQSKVKADLAKKVEPVEPAGPTKEQYEEQLRLLRIQESKRKEKIAKIEEGGVTRDEMKSLKRNEQVIKDNQKQQALLLAAIEKLTQTTANLKQD